MLPKDVTNFIVQHIRPFLVASLCLLVSGGNLTAWLHVATCHSNSAELSDPTGPAPKELTTACSDCKYRHADHDSIVASQPAKHAPCSRSSSDNSGNTNNSVADCDGHDADDHPEHDSDDCILCNSLFTSATVDWIDFTPSFEFHHFEFLATCNASAVASAAIAIAAPRGPPLS